ncbi:universal stress protein [Phycicoccus flavus]|uniref:universal stress protein n=1 Tax=Phycicoccus flavus TaxID=2502783 RepID=UPI000FEBFF35|nr:universal stress protein [Phycicoccus flavus]NHA66775.1 universal stress protein [Phycicoccus flavus]
MSQSRVVVGVDGSPLSTTAVLQASHYASSRGMSLHVLHAFAPDLPMLGFGALSDRTAVTGHGRQLLAAAAARAHAAHPDLTVTTGLQDGYASQALISSSRSADLVVVGAVGFGLLSRATMGAVAMQVLTHAQCPVLVVGHETGGAPVPGSRVVVGVDGSDDSLEALRAGAREAGVLDGTLEVVHTWQAKGAADPTLGRASSWEEYERVVEQRVRTALTSTEVPEVKCEVHILRDEPVHALAAHTEGASLLVVGSRGTGGFQGLHVGSTALRLVARSACPVLVTR